MDRRTIRQLVLFTIALLITGTIFIVLWYRVDGDRVYHTGPNSARTVETFPCHSDCGVDDPNKVCWVENNPSQPQGIEVICRDLK
jgi:hypothetical protein